MISVIIENPFLVRGIASDRVWLNTYPHNLVLELLYQGGVILATPFILLIIFYVFRTFYSTKNEKNMLRFIFFCASIPQLMVSSSLWLSYSFWVWMAICVENNRTNVPSIKGVAFEEKNSR